MPFKVQMWKIGESKKMEEKVVHVANKALWHVLASHPDPFLDKCVNELFTH